MNQHMNYETLSAEDTQALLMMFSKQPKQIEYSAERPEEEQYDAALFQLSRSATARDHINVFTKYEAELNEPALCLMFLHNSCYGSTPEDIQWFRVAFQKYKAELPQHPALYSSTDTITVYRGIPADKPEAATGICWSTNRDVAKKFGAVILERVVSKADVLCWIAGPEQEVIVNTTAAMLS